MKSTQTIKFERPSIGPKMVIFIYVSYCTFCFIAFHFEIFHPCLLWFGFWWNCFHQMSLFSKAVAVFESDFWSSDCDNELMLAINQVGANIDTRGAPAVEIGGWDMAWKPKGHFEGWKGGRITDVSIFVGESSVIIFGLFGLMIGLESMITSERWLRNSEVK